MFRFLLISAISLAIIFGCNTTTEPNQRIHDDENTTLSSISGIKETKLITISVIDNNGNVVDTGVYDIICTDGLSLSAKIQKYADGSDNKGEFITQLMRVLREQIRTGAINREASLKVLRTLVRAELP